MPDGETMTNALVGKNGSGPVADDLMHLDCDPFGILGVKNERLYMRVDLAPLLCPISADLIGATDKTAFERSGPSHVWRHEGEGRVNVPRVESRVGGAKQRDLGR